MAGWLDSPVFRFLEKGLDASSLRQKLLSNNIANVDTPGFKRSDVDFQKALAGAIEKDSLPLKRTLPEHLPGVNDEAGQPILTDPSSIHKDGNNVDIDREMANVAENNIYYNALTRAENVQIGILRLLINQKE